MYYICIIYVLLYIFGSSPEMDRAMLEPLYYNYIIIFWQLAGDGPGDARAGALRPPPRRRLLQGNNIIYIIIM